MISVCIATYNGEKYILEQLQSILPQLSADGEIIISDDHSTDRTIEVISSIRDPRIHMYFHDSDIDARFTIDHSTHNFENALLHAKGDIIFLSDQDDYWLPEKIQVMSKALEFSDLAISDCIIGNEKLQPTKLLYSDLRAFKTGLLNNLLQSHYLGCCMAFKKEVLIKALPFPKHGVAHDLWLGMTAEQFFNVKYISQPLSIYRRHANTVTASGKSNDTSMAFKIKYRLYIIKAILQHNFLPQLSL